MPALTKIELAGELGTRFGETHTYLVSSAAEALRALCTNLPGFERYLRRNSRPGYTVYIDGRDRSADEIRLQRNPQEITIVPAVVGAGKSPITQIVIGVILIAVAVGSGGTGASPAMAAFSNMMMGVGFSMVLGGVAQLIVGDAALTPDMTSPSEDRPVWAYDGPQNVTAQGVPVPVVYGIFEVGSVVASFGFYAEEFNPDSGDTGVGFRITSRGADVPLPRDPDTNEPIPQPDETINVPLTTASGTGPYTWEIDNDQNADYYNVRISGTTLISDPFPVPKELTTRVKVTDGTGQVATRTLRFSYYYERGRLPAVTITEA